MYVVVTSKGRTIRADYQGGAYIDLTFGHTGHKPTEVINVWDYATGKAEPPFDDWENLSNEKARQAVRDQVKAWIKSNEEEGWESWYRDYIENARY